MKLVKILVILVIIYAGIVAAFELFIGTAQPQNDGTIVLTTTNSEGVSNDRVVSRLEVNGKTYVAANHWPRAWYNDVLERPDIQVTMDGETAPFTVVPVDGAEADAVKAARPRGLVFSILMGFAPREIVRLDPA